MRIAIVSPNKKTYSETFIKAHVELLEGEKFFLYGSYKPLYHSEKSLVFLLPVFKRILMKYVFKTDILDYSIMYFLRKNKVELILAEYGPTGCAMLPIARKLIIPLIVHFHGYDASSKRLLIEYQESYKNLFEYSNCIIAVSLQMQENLIKIGAKKEKVVYDPYGPASAFIDIAPDYYNSDTVLFVGRFVDKKAPYLLIEIMKNVRDKGIQLKLVMAGDGVLLDTCRGLVKIHNLEDYIIFPGVASHTKVRDLMANSFCYIQHSVTTRDGETEGTPVSILEASQAGLPVISTKHAGIPDVIIHGETGFLVNEFDVDSMTEYLILLNGDRKLAHKMGMRGKKRVIEKFSLEKHISILNYEIEKAVNGS
jgi:glycosyltransferase involved in cell wall biosynthesis